MRALLDKELRPFLAPACVGALLFTGAYVLAFDVERTLLAPPSEALPVVVFAALCCGALLGYSQLALERQGDTLSYLLHRDQPPGRVLAAKCLAGWVLLAIVVHLPLVLFALWERWASPLGHVLRWPEVGELALAGVACVPAHALGLLCATLRCAPGGRPALLLLWVAGLGLALSLLLGYPFASVGVARAVYAGSLLLFGAALLRCVLSALRLVEDADRAPPAGRLASLGLLSLLLIGVPAVGGLAVIQGVAVRAGPLGQELLWREDVGLVRATWEHGELKTAHGANGEPVDLVALIQPERRTWLNELDLVCAGFTTVWSSDDPGRFWSTPVQRSSSPGTPSIAPVWEELAAVDFWARSSTKTVGGARAYFKREEGCVLVLHAARWPEAKAPDSRAHTSSFVDAPRSTLRTLLRGDGRPFSPSTFRRDDWSTLEAPNGRALRFGRETVLLEDPADDTLWSLDLGDPVSVFVAVEVKGAAELRAEPEVQPASEPPRVRTVVEGDRASYTVRAIERETGELLLEQRGGPLAGGQGVLLPVLLLGSNLLHPPALVLAAHLAPQEQGWYEDELLGGVLTGRGRRPLLVVAGFALSCALAWLADRRLARRGAERWRRLAWGTALVLLGPLAWLAYITLEPRAPRTATVSAAPRRLLLASGEQAG